MGTCKTDAVIQEYPCGKNSCTAEVFDEGIGCDTCGIWFHPKCSGLTSGSFLLYGQHKRLKWVCPACTILLRDIKKKERLASRPKLKPKRRGCTAPEPHSVEIGDETEPKEVRKKAKRREKRSGTKEGAPASSGTEGEITATLERLAKRMEEQEENLNRLIKEKCILGEVVEKLRKNTDVAIGRHRNVLVHGVPEPYMRQGRLRDRYMRDHLATLIRAVAIPDYVLLKRVLRLGQWKDPKATGAAKPRPIIVEFGNPRHRDRFLAAAEKIRASSGGNVRVTPDDRPSGRLKAETIAWVAQAQQARVVLPKLSEENRVPGTPKPHTKPRGNVSPDGPKPSYREVLLRPPKEKGPVRPKQARKPGSIGGTNEKATTDGEQAQKNGAETRE